MEARQQISEFLTSRRARITPERAGLPVYGTRRVPGLRREEVAVLAGVSVPYYTRLERGDLSGASDGVLDALSRALQLDDAERTHLFDLARAVQPTASPRRRRPRPTAVRPSAQWILDAMTGAAAVILNGRQDVLASNALARALFAAALESTTQPANMLRFTFLDPRAEDFYDDWETIADQSVAILRAEAGRDPDDPALVELVGQLSTRSDAFRTRWGTHDVRFHHAGAKTFHHATVGELALNYERLDLATDPGLAIVTYTAEPGTRSAESFALLASWAAAPAPAQD